VPLYVSIFENSNLSAVIPLMQVRSWLTGKRAVSLPFSDFCKPLVKDENLFRDLFDYMINLAKTKFWSYIELKGSENFLDEDKNSLVEYHHSLKLSKDLEMLFSSFSSNTRRNIKKAERENLHISMSNSLNALKVFYKLNCITRKRHGLPPQPFSFFKNLHKYILSNQLGFVVNASFENKIIASAVCLLFGKKAIYKFGASDMNYQNLRANNLVMWRAISWCAENGYEDFSFGKTEAENDGLRRFKNGWNTKEYELKTYRYDLKASQFIKLKTKTHGNHNKYFSALPIPVLKVIGRLIYRHLG